MMSSKRYFFLVLILGSLSALGPFSIDMYLPGFPRIAEDMDTDVAKVSLSLSSFFIGICFGQMLYGPILDKFGRKKPLYFGITLYLLASIACAFVTTVNGLIFMRFIQAIGACAGLVASRAMVRDFFPVKESARVFSLLMLVIGVSPLIAPTLGGYLTAHFGWHYVFIALTALAFLILCGIHFVLPESIVPDKNLSLKPKPILRGFYAILKTPQFYVYTVSGAIAASGLYAYISGSPFVFMELFEVTEQQYGWIFAGVAMGLILASQLNSLLLKKYSSSQIIPVALAVQTLAGLSMAFLAYTDGLTLALTIGLVAVFLACQGFVFPNTSALALAPFAKQAGSASALMGAIQMGLGALASALVSILNDHTALPMTGVMGFCTFAAFLILITGSAYIKKLERRPVEDTATEIIV